jgi:molecular chaperone GrpE
MRSDRTDEASPSPDENAGAEAAPQQAESDAPAADEAGTPEGSADFDEIAATLQGPRSELDDLRDRYLRLAAEYDNYRKRTERERSESFVKAQSQLVQKLLDAVDDLERVADYTEESTTVAALLEGVQMVERKLLRALEAAGLEHLEVHGAAFNPTEHEALMTASTESPHEDDTVGEVFQKGYRFQGHLLRPARVQVRKHGG